ncbi:NADPH-dependent F420 reductase [Parafrankia sp. EUN1f]|uniref:NADPH-dependent F420 reductase n=1 Tax=Parafrankia sp. EUN1f TaxID=102897 RepID=UPI0001C46FBE|nr:NADPH-dependent F420 reductase [Parafrankia sp. EUN1f]EFC86753.1 NADP oxidoreductase coenzyme F420-dependent [Parafrankia sp. EUN1f]
MATLGIIGSGNIGSAVARLAVSCGETVVVANSRGPESLGELVAELGPSSSAGTIDQAAAAKLVVLSVPLFAIPSLPSGLLKNQIVLDTTNYYPSRDGRVAELDSDERTTSQLVLDWLGGDARVVKVFNNILAHHIPQLARPVGVAARTALPVASDDDEAKTVAVELIERLGFETVDAGSLSESWRFEPEAAAYTRMYLADPATPVERFLEAPGGPVSVDRLRSTLASATRVRVAGRIF